MGVRIVFLGRVSRDLGVSVLLLLLSLLIAVSWAVVVVEVEEVVGLSFRLVEGLRFLNGLHRLKLLNLLDRWFLLHLRWLRRGLRLERHRRRNLLDLLDLNLLEVLVLRLRLLQALRLLLDLIHLLLRRLLRLRHQRLRIHRRRLRVIYIFRHRLRLLKECHRERISHHLRLLIILR